eukprot:246923_1
MTMNIESNRDTIISGNVITDNSDHSIDNSKHCTNNDHSTQIIINNINHYHFHGGKRKISSSNDEPPKKRFKSGNNIDQQNIGKKQPKNGKKEELKLKAQNESNQNNNIKNGNNEINILQQTVIARDNEIENLKNQINCLQHEKKEMELEINALKKKNMTRTRPDNINWIKWNENDILMWIMSLENGRFKKYESILLSALKEQEVMGDDLKYVNENDIFNWGIKKIKDKKVLYSKIKWLTELTNNNLDGDTADL